MTIWFTSDEHYGHRKIIEYSSRPFSSLGEMTETIISRHNQCVRTEDVVWHLGDFAMDERLVKQILPRLNGQHVLVAGNHDKCHAMHKKHLAMTQKYIDWGFDRVLQNGKYYFSGDFPVWVQLSHLPYVGDSVSEKRPNGEDRFPEFRLRDCGEWLLHGHVHELWKIRGRMINVGVDQWNFYPVSEMDILGIIKSDGRDWVNNAKSEIGCDCIDCITAGRLTH